MSTAPVCRLEPEFRGAIYGFEKAGVDAIVTLHMAYSPSLESSTALAATRLPIVVLDTTPTYAYGPQQNPEELLYNHGIHGVQDMCNLLLRNHKAFQIEAGFWEKTDVLDRVAAWVRAARLASAIRQSRIGQLGPPSRVWGFCRSRAVLAKTLGVKTIVAGPEAVPSLVAKVTKKAVETEMAADREQFMVENLDPELHRRATKAGLACAAGSKVKS